MTEKTEALRATLKAGAGYDAPWLTVDAADPAELVAKLNAIENGGVSEALVSAANTLKAVNSAAPIAAEVASPPPAAPPAPSGWGTPAPPQAPVAAPQAVGPVNGTPHPEGILCPVDNVPVVFKRTPPRRTDGKSFEFWSCPNQKSRNDGHYSAFAD